MENKLKVWIARDEDGILYLYFIHPLKSKSKKEWRLPDFHNEDGVGAKRIDSDLFPSVQWEDDEPTEAYITLAEPQEQTKQEQSKQEYKIDWEQRRYEIAMELLPLLYRKSTETLTLEDAVDGALNFADTLIAKLKEQSE